MDSDGFERLLRNLQNFDRDNILVVMGYMQNKSAPPNMDIFV